jgi:hypothetical protein
MGEERRSYLQWLIYGSIIKDWISAGARTGRQDKSKERKHIPRTLSESLCLHKKSSRSETKSKVIVTKNTIGKGRRSILNVGSV